MTTIFQLAAAGALPRSDWVEVDSGTGGGTSGRIVVLHQACEGEDADNNPTPDTTAFPPADYPPGSLFIPTSYLATLNSAANTVEGAKMLFRREGGSGAEEWVWIDGSFWASTTTGYYRREADGTQECWGYRIGTGDFFGGTEHTWTYPAAFATTDGLTVLGTADTTTKSIIATVTAVTATSAKLQVSASNGIGWNPLAKGAWKTAA